MLDAYPVKSGGLNRMSWAIVCTRDIYGVCVKFDGFWHYSAHNMIVVVKFLRFQYIVATCMYMYMYILNFDSIPATCVRLPWRGTRTS